MVAPVPITSGAAATRRGTGATVVRAALIVAFPVSSVPMMLASRHGTGNDQQLVASTVAVSLVLSIITMPLIIHITS